MAVININISSRVMMGILGEVKGVGMIGPTTMVEVVGVEGEEEEAEAEAEEAMADIDQDLFGIGSS